MIHPEFMWLNYQWIIPKMIEFLITKLKKEVKVVSIGKESDIISISLNSTNIDYAKNIVNEIIDVFNEDGVLDRRLIHKRTIDFVNDTRSSIIDAPSTLITDSNLLKIYSWYDNETGYACRMNDIARMINNSLDV